MKFPWEMKTIGSISSAAERFEAPIAGERYRQIGVRLWGEGAYERASIDGIDTQYRSLNKTANGDIIVSKIWARNGSVSVVSPELEGCYCSGEFPLFSPDLSQLIPDWFFWITKTDWFWNSCDIKARGTSGKNRIRPEKFLEIEIPLPPLSEQKRISKILHSIVGQRDQAEKLRQEVITDAQSLLHSVFHEIIDGSEYRTINEVAPVNRRKVETEIDGKYPELAVRSFGRGVFHKPTLLGSELSWQQLYQIKTNDLVFSNIKAWEGALAVATEDDNGRFASHRYITCKVKADVIIADFLCFYLLSPEGIERVRDASLGSADRNRTLAIKRLELIEVPVPSYEKQLQFYELQKKVSTIQKTKAENQVELDALLPAILDKAFKGEL